MNPHWKYLLPEPTSVAVSASVAFGESVVFDEKMDLFVTKAVVPEEPFWSYDDSDCRKPWMRYFGYVRRVPTKNPFIVRIDEAELAHSGRTSW